MANNKTGTVNWIEPSFTRTQVREAGKRVRKDNSTLKDELVIENWRASHSYIMNTFKPMLYGRAKRGGFKVAQRLKRKNTIYDKLRREPSMQLTTMHDIAGFRLIFQNEKQLFDWRGDLHASRARSELKTRTGDPYNYIKNPKSSGYRGVHDVYEYVGSSKQGKKWDGLLLEIQYRTEIQHAWATAVEIADFITNNRIKFNDAEMAEREFFRHASEILSRHYEDAYFCLAKKPDKKLIHDFESLNKKTGLLDTFSRLKKAEHTKILKKHTLLIFRSSSDVEESSLQTETFDSVNLAIRRYDELEKELEGIADIVLVRADSPETVRLAFKSYFSDAREFVSLINDAIENFN